MDSLKRREEFAVSLRREKKKEIISAKRRKLLSKVKTVAGGITTVSTMSGATLQLMIERDDPSNHDDLNARASQLAPRIKTELDMTLTEKV